METEWKRKWNANGMEMESNENGMEMESNKPSVHSISISFPFQFHFIPFHAK